MSKDEKEAAPTEAPKKSKKMLIIIVLAVVLLGGGGAGAYFMLLAPDKAAAAEKPVKGAVVSMENALTINLAESHYLKLAFAMQMTEEAGEVEIDSAEALDLAIEHYTGREIAELQTAKGREQAKKELLEKIEKAYNVDGKHLVMDLYFTQYVTQ
jgi:flagellar FliL protein